MIERNTLICGDCLQVMADIEDHSVDMILCDPPYGTTHNVWDEAIPMEPLWEHYRRIIKPGGAIVLFSQQPFASRLVTAGGKLFRYELIWEKTNAVGYLNANRMPMRAHENILVFYDRLPTYNPQFVPGAAYAQISRPPEQERTYGAVNRVDTINDGRRYPRSIVTFPKDRISHHPTEKPVALCEWLIKTYTDPGELVLDNCMGGGSIVVAAQNTGRDFIGIEQDPDYFATASARINGAA